MAQYDHPSFITRQMEFIGITTAGNGTTSFRIPFPTAMRLRRVAGVVMTAGTSTGALVNVIAVIPGTSTNTLGNITVSTGTVGTTVVSTDYNTLIPLGAYISLQNGTDATAVVSVGVEYHLDPLLATFTNP